LSKPYPPGMTLRNPAAAKLRTLSAHRTHLDTDQIGLIELDGQPVEYVIRRSLRRTRAMLSLSERGLVLAVPMRMSARSIALFLQHSHPWLLRHLPRWRANGRPHVELAMLQQVLWRGTCLPVDVSHAPVPSVRVLDSRVSVGLPDPQDPGAVRHALRTWVQTQALPHFEDRARHFAPAVGVDVPSIKLTNARTLWGSCTPAGLVRLNWRLMQGPAHLVDYVVVHELAHLVEANHSARFWAVVERGYTEHRAARRELTEWQRRLAAL